MQNKEIFDYVTDRVDHSISSMVKLKNKAAAVTAGRRSDAETLTINMLAEIAVTLTELTTCMSIPLIWHQKSINDLHVMVNGKTTLSMLLGNIGMGASIIFGEKWTDLCNDMVSSIITAQKSDRVKPPHREEFLDKDSLFTLLTQNPAIVVAMIIAMTGLPNTIN